MNYVEEMYRDGYLAHIGRGHEDGGHSGRYPWGSHNNVANHVREYARNSGERAYRSDDGELTERGKRRQNRDTYDNGGRTREADPNRWVLEDMSRMKSVNESGAKFVKQATDFVNGMPVSQKKIDLSGKSNQQLREEIERRELENKYQKTFASTQIPKGRQVVKSALETGGSLLMFTGTALEIAMTVKKLMGPRQVNSNGTK